MSRETLAKQVHRLLEPGCKCKKYTTDLNSALDCVNYIEFNKGVTVEQYETFYSFFPETSDLLFPKDGSSPAEFICKAFVTSMEERLVNV